MTEERSIAHFLYGRETIPTTMAEDDACYLVMLTGDQIEILSNLVNYAHRRTSWLDETINADSYYMPDDTAWDTLEAVVDDLEYRLMSTCDYVTLDDTNERVGINDNEPSQSLSVSGSGAPSIQVHDDVVSQVLVQCGTVFPRVVLDDNQEGGDRWDIGTGLSSAASVGSLYIRDNDQGVTALILDQDGGAKIYGAFGCNGQAPQAAYALPSAASDLPTAITLVNALRVALDAMGICHV